MPQSSKTSPRSKARVLGTKVFAAITAVEGLQLSTTSRRRLDALKSTGLSAEERRAEVLRAYTGLSGKK